VVALDDASELQRQGAKFCQSAQYDEGIACFEEALKLNPSDVRASECLALALELKARTLHERNVKEAIHYLDKAIRIHPTHSAWAIKAAYLMIDYGRIGEALVCLNNAIKINPQFSGHWFNKGMPLKYMGHYEKAVECFKHSLDLDPVRETNAVNEINLLSQNIERMQAAEARIRVPTTHAKGEIVAGAYRILHILGVGGFGEVYLAEYSDEHPLALKCIRRELFANQEVRKRFHDEAALWIKLGRHPYLNWAWWIDVFNGHTYIAMDYVAPDDRGINSLKGYLQTTGLELPQILKWAVQLCLGLEYAYANGIRCHLDIKPENILITRENILKLTDFGMAQLLATKPSVSANLQQDAATYSQKTNEGIGFGTPTHMPPEQFTSALTCDMRSDIYAIGIVLYQITTGGRLPFVTPYPRDASKAEMLRFWKDMYRLHSTSRVPPLDSPLWPMIRRCLEKDRSSRYQTPQELREDVSGLYRRLYNEELKVLMNANDLPREDDHSLVVKGDCLGRLGNHNEALACFEKALSMNHENALKIKPNSSETLSNKGMTLARLHKYDEAIHCLNVALELNPDNVPALYNKAAAEEVTGCFPEAVKSLQQFIATALASRESLDYTKRIELARVRIKTLNARILRDGPNARST
jgi:serine/threonine protein kinase